MQIFIIHTWVSLCKLKSSGCFVKVKTFFSVIFDGRKMRKKIYCYLLISLLTLFPFLFTWCLGTEIEETTSSRQSNSFFSQEQLHFWFGWKKDPACSSCPLQQFVNSKFYFSLKSECFFIVFLTCKAGWKSLENRSSHESIWTSGQDRVSWISIPDNILVISLLVPAGTCTCWGSCKTDNKLNWTTSSFGRALELSLNLGRRKFRLILFIYITSFIS